MLNSIYIAYSPDFHYLKGMDIHLIDPDHRPSRSDALQNRALLLNTAQILFEEQGVEAVSMTAIAQAAGVGKGTLYRHFGSKTDLCMALLDQDMRQLQERVFLYFRQQADPLLKLQWFLEEVLRYVHRNLKFLMVGVQEGQHDLQHPAHIWWRHTILKLLQQLDVADDLEYLTDTLYIMLDVHTIRFQLETLGYSLERIVQGLLSLLYQITR